MSDESIIEADSDQDAKQKEATFEELLAMLESGMDEQQAFKWAFVNNLQLTEEQLDFLERDLEIFDAEAMLRPDYDASETDLETALRLKKEAEQKAKEKRQLTPKEKREVMLGALKAFVIVVAIIGVYLYFL